MSDATMMQIAVAANTLGIGFVALTTIISAVMANRKADKAIKQAKELADAQAEQAAAAAVQATALAAAQAEQAKAAAARDEQVKRTLMETTAQAKAAAVEVKQVLVESTERQDGHAANTEAKLDGLAIVAKSSHAFLNSERGVMLTRVATLARWKADSTRARDDIKAAEVAEADLAAHMAAQVVVDAQPGTDDQKKGQ